MKIFMFIAMADAAMFSNMCLSSLTCPLGLYKLLAVTVFF